MARTKTTEMSTITAAQLADGDLIPVIDVSDTTMSSTGTNKKLAKSQLAEAAGVTAHAAVTSSVHGISAFGATLVDDADAATARSTLGLGTIATQAAGSVAITGGSVTGITDLAVADGGTGGSTAAAALANLTSTTLAADGDILTRSGGAPAPITRANLAADTAFSSRYAPGDTTQLGPITNAGGTAAIEPVNSNDVDTFTPVAWAGDDLPMRLRISHAAPDSGGYGAQHFQIVPYEFGMAIEYPGVVECWVKEWSIHNNSEGSPDPGGAILWVGNDDDTGGLRIQAYRSGSTKYVNICPELFDRSSGGNLNFNLRNSTDKYAFQTGAAGSEIEKVRLTGAGVLFIGVDAYGSVDGRLTVAADSSSQIAASFISKGGTPTVDTVRIMNEFAGITSRFNKSGAFGTRVTSAPADADIATSEVFMWFDSTAGAAKVKFKGKNASGTVVSGEVSLS